MPHANEGHPVHSVYLQLTVVGFKVVGLIVGEDVVGNVG